MAEPQNQPLDIEALLAELANKIERVKVLYEQYFMGIEKMEPSVARKEIQRAMLQLQQMYIRNTGLRFKFNTLLQKWNIYITYWNRILREIEAGTYIRHLKKAERAAARKGEELPEEMTHKSRPPSGQFPVTGAQKRGAHDEDSGVHVLAVQGRVAAKTDPLIERIPAGQTPSILPPRAPATPPPKEPHFPPPPPPPPAAMRPRPPAGPPPPPRVPGMNDDELRTLHQKLVDARKRTGEPSPSYEKLVESLARQTPKVLAQPGVAKVRYDVSIQDGKAVLKAFPVKKT